MKTCPKCGSTHEKTGNFCSRKCGNSRVFSQESNEKKRKSALAFYSTMSADERKQFQKEKMKSYDVAEQQRKAAQTKRLQSWSRPYEEMAHGSLRKRLLIERNHTCEECGQGAVWNGKPLSLELDHIDGNNKNNKIENLRILCPNCHAQTPTFRSKNIIYKKLSDPRRAQGGPADC